MKNAVIIGGAALAGVVLYESTKGSGPAKSASSAVANGDTLNYTATITTGFTQSGNDVLSQVAAALPALGVTVLSSSGNSSIGQEALDAISFEGNTIGVSLQVQVTGQGFARKEDVQADIDHAFYEVTGNLPQSSGISFAPGSGATAQAPAAPGLLQTTGLDGIASKLETLGTGTVLGVGLVLIAALALFAFTERPRVSV